MKAFYFMQVTISHNLKGPHSKALEPDCLSPLLMVTTQPLAGEGWGEWDKDKMLTPTPAYRQAGAPSLIKGEGSFSGSFVTSFHYSSRLLQGIDHLVSFPQKLGLEESMFVSIGRK